MAVVDREAAAPSAPPMREGLLQFQLRRLIGEILSQADLEPHIRASLLRHTALHPENPGLALLYLLHDVHAADDLSASGRHSPMEAAPGV
jgi:hypothetical protein